MLISIGFWLSLCFSIGFIFESIFGFGGGIVTYSLLGFFFDIKNIVVVGMYVGTIASITIFATSIKDVDFKIVKSTILYILFGVMVGVVCFKILPSKTLIKIYSLTLMFISLRALLFKNVKIFRFENYHKILSKKLYLNKFINIFHKKSNDSDKLNERNLSKKKQKLKIDNKNLYLLAGSKCVLCIGGFIQGVLGIGGPFFVLGLKSNNIQKTTLRATLSCIFIISNFFRITYLLATKTVSISSVKTFWYVPIPVMLSLWIGYKIHKIIPQKSFDTYIYLGILFSSIAFILLLL